MAEVEALIQARFGKQAVARCGDLLQAFGSTPAQTFTIRHARFQASKVARDSATFAADFVYLWNGPVLSKNRAKVRLFLLRTLIEIASPTLLPSLMLINDQLGQKVELKIIIDAKVEQLTRLRLFELRNQPSPKALIPNGGESKTERSSNPHE